MRPALHLLAAACLLAASYLLFAPSVSGTAPRQVERRLPAEPRGVVEVSSPAGTITVRGWDRPEVLVRAALEGDPEALDLERSGRRLEVRVRPGRHGAAPADLEIRLPAESEVLLATATARVEVSGLARRVRLESISGNLRLEGEGPMPGILEVSTVTGNLDARGGAGRVEAESVSGSLAFRGAFDEVRAETVSGSIRLASPGLLEARLETVSGSLAIEGGLERRGTIEAASHSGGISLALAAGAGARVEAKSRSGRVRDRLSEASGPAVRERSFTLGDGSGSIRLESFSGGIDLEPLAPARAPAGPGA